MIIKVVFLKIRDSNKFTKLLRDSTIIRLVSIIGNASLSNFELLEYNLKRREVNYALANGVIDIDESSSSSPQSSINSPDLNFDENKILVSDEYYFYNFLNSKVKLTDLGKYILGTIKAGNEIKGNEITKGIERQQQQYFSSHFSNAQLKVTILSKMTKI
jgi:hypothetical protein